MKKIISFMAMISMAASMITVSANNAAPRIIVDDREITFEDQKPVITEADRALVPARGVFEALKASVEWNQEKQSVLIKSRDNLVYLNLTIDDPKMTRLNWTSLAHADKTEVVLEEPVQLMNDRTMIPLRVVSENINADVDWDEATNIINIKSKEYKRYLADKNNAAEGSTYNAKDALPNISLSADKESVAAGETITLTVNISNIGSLNADSAFVGLSTGILYDPEKFEFTEYKAIVDGEEVTQIMGAANESFSSDSLKFAYILIPSDTEKKTVFEGALATLKFTSLTGDGGEFILSNRYSSIRSEDTGYYYSLDAKTVSLNNATELYIDQTPVKVN